MSEYFRANMRSRIALFARAFISGWSLYFPWSLAGQLRSPHRAGPRGGPGDLLAGLRDSRGDLHAALRGFRAALRGVPSPGSGPRRAILQLRPARQPKTKTPSGAKSVRIGFGQSCPISMDLSLPVQRQIVGLRHPTLIWINGPRNQTMRSV